MKENRLFEVLETRVANEAGNREIEVVAKLAKRCLKLVGKKRPTMKVVVIQLETLREFQHQAHNYAVAFKEFMTGSLQELTG
ncbi:hypothetical protein GIB67_017247 [Kingdonia uniflora]|uniref:Uncharacterized protein n=1 Tax=Kingdonia uniflora TaxID=39325 RepID=A0A7J7NBP8_9MAGN|nr:hypothetical protein GIB67_017247 [Kingdonia uniflora]